MLLHLKMLCVDRTRVLFVIVQTMCAIDFDWYLFEWKTCVGFLSVRFSSELRKYVILERCFLKAVNDDDNVL